MTRSLALVLLGVALGAGVSALAADPVVCPAGCVPAPTAEQQAIIDAARAAIEQAKAK